MTQPMMDLLFRAFTARLYVPSAPFAAQCQDLAERGYLRLVQDGHQTGYAIGKKGYREVQRHMGYTRG